MKSSFRVMSIGLVYLFLSIFTFWILFTFYLSTHDSEVIVWILLINGSLLAVSLIMKNQTFGRIYVTTEGVIMKCFWVTIHKMTWSDIISLGVVQIAGMYSLQIVYLVLRNDSRCEETMRFEYNRKALRVLEKYCPNKEFKNEIIRLRTTKWWK